MVAGMPPTTAFAPALYHGSKVSARCNAGTMYSIRVCRLNLKRTRLAASLNSLSSDIYRSHLHDELHAIDGGEILLGVSVHRDQVS